MPTNLELLTIPWQAQSNALAFIQLGMDAPRTLVMNPGMDPNYTVFELSL